jgi:hypothetical protein
MIRVYSRLKGGSIQKEVIEVDEEKAEFQMKKRESVKVNNKFRL